MKQQTVREHHDASLACGHTHRVDRTLRRMAAIKNACSGPNCVASHKKKGRSGPERLVSPQNDSKWLNEHLFLFLAEHGTESGFGIFITLTDFELPQDSVPADINFVPGIFQIAQYAFVHLAQIAQ